MCGIIGYIGKKEARPILMDGLKRLEYRGYDSAGIAILSDAKNIKLFRAKGKVEELEKKLPKKLRGYAGIAHTRWATHGEPSEKNAHPHTDCNGQIFVCHNGIIENYKTLKKELISQGHKFKSDTDTEVLPHLIEENLRYNNRGNKNVYRKNSLENSVIVSLKKVKGTYGLIIFAASQPDAIIAARNSSPMVIGIGKNENIISSDASVVVGRTKDVIYVNDNEIAIVKAGGIKLLDISEFLGSSNLKYRENKNLESSVIGVFETLKNFKARKVNISERKQKLDWDFEDSQKGGYPHFMLKEIFEQPESISNSLRGRLKKSIGEAKLGGLEIVKNELKNLHKIIITGCGTAYFAGIIGKMMIEELSGIPCEAELASELRYRNFFQKRQNLAMVAISQSGETADTLAVLRKFRENDEVISAKMQKFNSKNKILKEFSPNARDFNEINAEKSPMKGLALGIVNVVGSTIARETDAGVYNHAGPEIGVASTKAFTSQLTILALLALFLGKQKGLSDKQSAIIADELLKIPELIKKILKQENNIKKIADKYKDYNNFLYIGRKYNFPMALEGALKLKEISYIHAEGCGAGEMKHGSIAMIDENFPVVAIAPVDSVYEKTISNMEEIKARRGKIIAITTEGNNKIRHIAEDWLYIPKTLEMLTPILSAIPLQLLAYYIGIMRGIDVDKPRNLAKSVTVE